jgi:cell division septation protein DedD
MTAPRSPASPEETTHKTGLNPTHIGAAALAAVTAALVGSALGAAGTLIGAAGASVITTVGTAVYESSLRRTREKVRSFAHRTPPSPRSRQGSRTDRSRPAVVNTPLGDKQLTDSIDRGAQASAHSPWFATLRWSAVVIGALGAFLVALVFITSFEWVSGETVGGNGKGTTIGQIIDNPSGPRLPPAPPSPPNPSAPSSQTPTQAPTAPATSTTTPDDGVGVEPSAPKTSDRPVPSTVTPTPPLIPPVLPGIGG